MRQAILRSLSPYYPLRLPQIIILRPISQKIVDKNAYKDYYKQAFKIFACLAQSVEHSAVNRSVGGPSPSTGAKKNVKTFFFLCLFLARTPAAQSCGGTLCLDTSSELDALCCRKQVYTQRYFTGVPVPNRIKKLRCGARRAIDDTNRLI